MHQTFFEQMERTERMIGRTGVERLNFSRVALVGLGGVGSYVLEALVRAGIGSLVLVDHDLVERSNLNRQLLALHSTLGISKVEVGRQRALDINPGVEIISWPVFCTPENCQQILNEQKLDYVVDAIDVVASKVALIKTARALKLPVASSMGAGNKLDPTAFRIADISKTQVCPLARAVRRELRRCGIDQGVPTVYSIEPPLPVQSDSSIGSPGSISYVPAVAGLMLAGIVIKDLLKTSST